MVISTRGGFVVTAWRFQRAMILKGRGRKGRGVSDVRCLQVGVVEAMKELFVGPRGYSFRLPLVYTGQTGQRPMFLKNRRAKKRRKQGGRIKQAAVVSSQRGPL